MKLPRMRLSKNKKGMYEYILTKSVMLIFILGLVGIFYSLYTSLNIKSAGTIANSEADRIAKEIDDVISLKGVTNKVTIHLKRDLKVGKTIVPYTFEITDKGLVIIRFIHYPYQDIEGFASFGLELARVGGKDSITCTWTQLRGAASFIVTKESDYEYIVEEKALYRVVKVTIDAAEACSDQMVFEGRYVER